ncbi:MAG: hypothetical protein WC489_00600 [Patescibacteria group bacterium]
MEIVNNEGENILVSTNEKCGERITSYLTIGYPLTFVSEGAKLQGSDVSSSSLAP